MYVYGPTKSSSRLQWERKNADPCGTALLLWNKTVATTVDRVVLGFSAQDSSKLVTKVKTTLAHYELTDLARPNRAVR